MAIGTTFEQLRIDYPVTIRVWPTRTRTWWPRVRRFGWAPWASRLWALVSDWRDAAGARERSCRALHSVAGRRQMRRCGAIPTARWLDVLAQTICARVLARSAYSQSARDRQICSLHGLPV